MNRRNPARGVESRTHGPAVTAAGDGLEGSYAGTLFSVPSGGTCKVVIPSLDPVNWRTALCSPAFAGSAGDAVLVTFDWDKQPWVLSLSRVMPLTGSAWIAPTLINSWVNAGGGFETAGYLKDPFGFVHIKGVISGGAATTVAFVLPTGYRPGAKTDHALAGGGQFQLDTSGNAVIAGTTAAGLSGVTFLAEN
jgi:hypothetical protein